MFTVGLIAPAIASEEGAPFKVVHAEPLAALGEKLRPLPSQMWRGADAAYSIPISSNQTLWLFGDTFLARAGQPLQMINNSAARQTLDDATQPLQFIWGNSDTSLFPARKSWLWPLDGCNFKGHIYEFMNVMQSSHTRDPNFAFRSRSQLLMRLDNPGESSDHWHYSTTTYKVKGVQLGNAVFRDNDFMYVYSSSLKDAHGDAKHPTMLARISLASLEASSQIRPVVEYYCGDPFINSAINAQRKSWSKSPAHATILFFDGAPEMSVVKITGRSGLFAFYFPPGFGDTIMMRHANRPEGPWSEPLPIYKCPEDTKQYLLYSAKAHPELSQNKGDIVLTYCVNAVSATAEDATLEKPETYYYPRAIKVSLE